MWRPRGAPSESVASPFRSVYGRFGGIPLGHEGRRESALVLFPRPSEAPSLSVRPALPSGFTAIRDGGCYHGGEVEAGTSVGRHKMSLELFKEIREAQTRGERRVLATVATTRGSTQIGRAHV